MAEMLKRGDTVRALYAGVPGPTVWRITSFVMLPRGKGEKLHAILDEPHGGSYVLPTDQVIGEGFAHPVDQLERVQFSLWERVA